MSNSWDHIVDTDEYKSTFNRSEKIAEKAGFILNPDKERVEKVVGLMTMNLAAEGDYYCPCKQSHPLDRDKDVLCPCPDIKEEIDKDGMCFCRLFSS
ncbi:MAG: ferredoxin:thioredoxin reductase [Candidatus Sabulitectum sp.]|nr:ferredoxin:thioredoxin reductase [Candidatus Sabulitectum sp.]